MVDSFSTVSACCFLRDTVVVSYSYKIVIVVVLDNTVLRTVRYIGDFLSLQPSYYKVVDLVLRTGSAILPVVYSTVSTRS